MARLLYITANPKPIQESYSLTVGSAFLQVYKQNKPDDRIIELDLYGMKKLPYIDADVFSGWESLPRGQT